MSDPIVHSFHDVSLHQSDVQILEGTSWLNDNLISYFYEHLTYEVFKDYQDDVCFVHPSTMFMIGFIEDEDQIGEVLKDLKLNQKNYIFMPINNNSSLEEVGGSHWSLLMYCRNDNSFNYYDSMHNSNEKSARRIASHAWKAISSQQPEFKLLNSPQQRNGYDCGLFVLANSEYLYAHAKNIPCDAVTQERVTALRTKFKNLILSKTVANVSLFSLKKKVQK